MDQDEYPKIEIRQFNAFGVWNFKSESLQGSCSICKSELTLRCTDCQSKDDQQHQESDKQKCPIVSNQCSHPFHKHCIQSWIEERKRKGQMTTCALCPQSWDASDEIEQ